MAAAGGRPLRRDVAGGAVPADDDDEDDYVHARHIYDDPFEVRLARLLCATCINTPCVHGLTHAHAVQQHRT
jgi:hypothetical protein